MYRAMPSCCRTLRARWLGVGSVLHMLIYAFNIHVCIPRYLILEAFTDPVEQGTSQQGGEMHDYYNEATQSVSEGSDIDEPFGFSGKIQMCRSL